METSSSRRDFLRTATAPCVLAALGFSITSCDSQGPDENGGNGGGGNNLEGITVNGNQITIDLTAGNNSRLNTAGNALIIESAKTIVVNDGGTIRAFSNVCTHQGGSVSQFQGSQFICSLHGSRFNTKGVPVSGDAVATGPLPEFTVTRSGDTLTIVKA